MKHLPKALLIFIINGLFSLTSCDVRLDSVQKRIYNLGFPDENTILYCWNRSSSGWHISISYDYIHTYRLSEGPFDTKAVWAPDKQWIYFIRSDSQQVSRIWKMRYDGHEKRPITTEIIGCGNVGISPGGQWMVFNANVNNESHIIVCDTSGGNWRQITSSSLIPSSGPVHYNNPSWLPDGQSIIFEYYLANEGKRGLAIIHLNGSIIRFFSEIDHLSPSHPRWSPTRDEFVFVSNYGSEKYIYRMNEDGSDLIRLTEESISRDPDWSSDGELILYVYKGTYTYDNNKEESFNKIMTMKRDGAEKKFLLGRTNTNICQPVW